MEQLLRNRLKCKKCLDVIESRFTHEFVRCNCGSIFVDGGLDYCRFGWPGGPIEDWVESLCEYSPENGRSE